MSNATITNRPIARYSNGFEDEYKGRRNVKAGWAAFDKETGKLAFCGHSLDRETASKTARSTIRQNCWQGIIELYKVRGNGAKAAARKHNGAVRDEFEKRFVVEIVDV